MCCHVWVFELNLKCSSYLQRFYLRLFARFIYLLHLMMNRIERNRSRKGFSTSSIIYAPDFPPSIVLNIKRAIFTKNRKQIFTSCTDRIVWQLRQSCRCSDMISHRPRSREAIPRMLNCVTFHADEPFCHFLSKLANE